MCWLALLLIRVAENQAGQTWPKIRRELDRIHIGTFTGPAGTFRQLTDPSKAARDLLARLNIDQPRKIHELTAQRTLSKPSGTSRGLETRPALAIMPFPSSSQQSTL